MELKKVKGDDKSILVETVGETFTVTNAIRETLWEDSNVSEAAQVREHPYLSNPKIFIKTSHGSPITALEKAAEKIESQAKEFHEIFKKETKK